MTAGVYAQSPGATTHSIAGISVEGNKYVEAQTIRAISGLREGQQITLPNSTQIQNALRNLWKREQFSEVEINVDRITPLGVFLIIRVEEYSRLNRIIVYNNDELSEEEIKDAAKMVRGDILSDYDLYLVKKRILNAYEEEGLSFATVDTETDPTDTANYVNLKIYVEEGTNFYVEKIEFEGNDFFDDDDLADAFEETHTKSWWQVWRSSKFEKNEYETDLENLKKFFQREGFIDAQIINDTVIYNKEKQTVDIKVQVREGQRVYIRDIYFRGNTVYDSDILKKLLNFESGEAYNMERFQNNLYSTNEEQTGVSAIYMDHGYLMARFETEENRVAPDSVDLVVNVYEGDRIHIRKVNIVGNTKTKDKVIRRELYTRPGDYFDRSAIIRSVRALGVLQYFNPEALRPDVKPVPTDATAVDLEYTVEEQSTDTFNASVGFAGVYGLTGSIGMTFNNFSLTEPLKGGAGQVLNFNWEFGEASQYQRFSLGFTEPWFLNEPTTIGFNIFAYKFNYFYKLSSVGGTINIGRRFRWPDDYFRGDWSISVQENDNGSGVSQFYRPGKSTEISLTQSFSRISLDNRFFATSGSMFRFRTSFAGGALGLGTTDYLKNELKFEFYNPLLKVQDYNRVVLYMGAQMGYIAGLESDTALTPRELYYMGGNGLSGMIGVTPLRGYQERVLGPEYGGKVMSKYTAELRFAVSVQPMPIYVYGFAEAGNVWANLRSTDPFNLKRSAGIGLQLMINPIGVIGFSYGYGFDQDRSGEVSGWQFLFHLGQNM